MPSDRPPDSGASLPPHRFLWEYGQRWLGPNWLDPDLQPAVRFVLFGGQRCGKSILMGLLRQYGQVKCDRNLLSHGSFFPFWYLHRQALRSQAEVYGFQLSSHDLLVGQRLREPGQILQLLHHQGYRILHLHRQNIMRHAVALLKAQQSGDTPTLKRQPLHVDPDQLLAQLAQLEKQRLEEIAMLSAVPHLRITYETDLLNPNHHEQTAHRLSSFLGADWQPQTCLGLRLVHQHLADLIVNYDEVRQALEQSDYAYVLSQQSLQLAI